MDDKDLKGWKRCCLRSWHPRPTANNAVLIFLALGLTLLIIGIVLYTKSDKLIENVIPYYKSCDKLQTCHIDINIEEEMKGPVFVYYEIHGFYQNHRRYVRSQSLSQLAGEEISINQAETSCYPIVRNKDIPKKISITNDPLIENDIAYPCGLIANSMFNDSYVFPSLNVDETNIIWKEDIGKKYKNLPLSKRNKQWLDVENPHFIVWMRTAGLNNFRKLWGRVNQTIPKGTLSISIINNYDVKTFDGKKFLVLSNASEYGGKNYFLAVAYMVIGSIFFLIAGFFLCTYHMSFKKFGSPFKDD